MEQVRRIISGAAGETPKNIPVPNMTYKYQMEQQAKPCCAYITTLSHREASKTHRRGVFFPSSPAPPLPAPLCPINNHNNNFPERPCLVFGIRKDPRGSVGHRWRRERERESERD